MSIGTAELSVSQRQVLQSTYDWFRETGSWPHARELDRLLDRAVELDVVAVAPSIPPSLIFWDRRGGEVLPDQAVKLTIAGIATCEQSKADLKLFLRILRYCVDRERRAPPPAPGKAAEVLVTRHDIAVLLGIDRRPDAESEIVLRKAFELLVVNGDLWNQASGNGDGDWSFHLHERRVRRYRDVHSISDFLALKEKEQAEAGAGNQVTDPAANGRTTIDRQAVDATFEFDVALSDAGEDRKYVHDVAQRLDGKGVKVFYDEFAVVDTWGVDLYAFFDDIYRRRARFAVVFISQHYVSKPWPTHERQSAQARALVERDPYLLPVRFDNSELPGLRPTIKYVDARQTSVEQLVELILQKVRGLPAPADPVPRPVIGVPYTPEQQRELLAQRSPFWEHLLYASVLAQGKEGLEAKWRDHELRYIRVPGPALDDNQTIALIQGAPSEVLTFVRNVDRVFDSRAQEAAFGPPGVPGDPVQIEHLGQRLIAIYEDLLDWAARVRGTRTAPEFERTFDLMVCLMDGPIAHIRDFIDDFVAGVDRIPDQLAEAPEDPIELNFLLTLDINSQTVDELGEELSRLLSS